MLDKLKWTQREVIRKALLEAYDNARKSDESYSWGSVIAEIQECFSCISEEERKKWPSEYWDMREIELGRSNNFSRFPYGKVQGIEPIRLLAIAYWLLNEDNKWSSLTESRLFSRSAGKKLAIDLLDFLYQDIDEYPRFDERRLKGEFQYENARRRLKLSVYQGSRQYLCPAMLYEERRFPGGSPEKSRRYEKYTYNGSILIAPNESLFCLFKNTEEESNHIFLPFGFDEVTDDDDQVFQNLLLFNQTLVEEFGDDDFQGEVEHLLKAWIKNNNENVYWFQRNH